MAYAAGGWVRGGSVAFSRRGVRVDDGGMMLQGLIRDEAVEAMIAGQETTWARVRVGGGDVILQGTASVFVAQTRAGILARYYRKLALRLARKNRKEDLRNTCMSFLFIEFRLANQKLLYRKVRKSENFQLSIIHHWILTNVKNRGLFPAKCVCGGHTKR